MSKNNSDNSLICTLDRYERQKAILKFQLGKYDLQELALAKRYLPKGCKLGDVLHIEILTSNQVSEAKENLAHALLEEILKGKS